MAEPDQPRPLPPDELGFERIVYEKDYPRATVTLNRPEVLNAFDFRMLRELARAFEGVVGRRDPRRRRHRRRPGVLRGADLRAWGEDLLGNSKEYWKWFGAFKDMHDRLREIGKPTVARVNGIAVGGGNELQMGCDLSVMVDGLHPPCRPRARLRPRRRRPRVAADHDRRPPRPRMILLCDEVPASKAAEWGLVNRAVPAASSTPS